MSKRRLRHESKMYQIIIKKIQVTSVFGVNCYNTEFDMTKKNLKKYVKSNIVVRIIIKSFKIKKIM